MYKPHTNVNILSYMPLSNFPYKYAKGSERVGVWKVPTKSEYNESILRPPRGERQNIPEKARGIMTISPTKAREKPRGDSPEVFPELLEGILSLFPRGFEVIF